MNESPISVRRYHHKDDIKNYRGSNTQHDFSKNMEDIRAIEKAMRITNKEICAYDA